MSRALQQGHLEYTTDLIKTASQLKMWNQMALVLAAVTGAAAVDSRARYMAKFVATIATVALMSIWGICVGAFCTIIGRRSVAQWIIARSYLTMVTPLSGWRFDVRGEENLTRHRPCVVICNHQSSMDVMIIGRIFPNHTSVMAKKALAWFPLLGQFMLLSGAVFIDRANRTNALKTFDGVVREIKARHMNLWIFPEGTRSRFNVPDLLPFKKGAFHLAVKAQVPIVPIVVENYSKLYNSKRMVYESGTVKIKVLEPIPTKGLSSSDVDALTVRTRELMLTNIKALAEESQEGSGNGSGSGGRMTALSLPVEHRPSEEKITTSEQVTRGAAKGELGVETVRGKLDQDNRPQ